jgi:hypothetical protein
MAGHAPRINVCGHGRAAAATAFSLILVKEKLLGTNGGNDPIVIEQQ